MDLASHPGISETNKSLFLTGQDMKDICHSDHRPCASQTRACVCGKEKMHACTCKNICVVWIKKPQCADLQSTLCFLRLLLIKVRICALVTPDI